MAKQKHQPEMSVKRLAELGTKNFYYMAAVIDWYGPYHHSPNGPKQFISTTGESTIGELWGEEAPALYAGFGMGEQPDELQHIGFAANASEYFRLLVQGEGQGDGGVQSTRSVCHRYYLGDVASQAIAGPKSRGRLYLYKFAEWVLVSWLKPRSNNDSRDVPNHGGIVWNRWWDPEKYEPIRKPLQSWRDVLTCSTIDEEEEDTNPRCRVQGVDLPRCE